MFGTNVALIKHIMYIYLIHTYEYDCAYTHNWNHPPFILFSWIVCFTCCITSITTTMAFYSYPSYRYLSKYTSPTTVQVYITYNCTGVQLYKGTIALIIILPKRKHLNNICATEQSQVNVDIWRKQILVHGC